MRLRRRTDSVGLPRLLLAGVAICLLSACTPKVFPPLIPSQMDGFSLAWEGNDLWQCGRGTEEVAAQKWVHIASGAGVYVKFGTFPSSVEAQSACEAEVAWSQTRLSYGTFSGQSLGDQCWRSASDRAEPGARLVFRSGRAVASAAALDPTLPLEVLELVARRLLANCSSDGGDR